MTKGGNEIADQIVGQRPGRLDPLLFQGDRGGLGLADPDRQVPVALGLPQQEHRLVLGLLNADANNPNFAICACPLKTLDPDRTTIAKSRP